MVGYRGKDRDNRSSGPCPGFWVDEVKRMIHGSRSPVVPLSRRILRHLSTSLLTIVGIAAPTIAQSSEATMVYSTNDYTTGGTAPSPLDWSEEGWADVKTVRAWLPSPAIWGTRTYSVGATTVSEAMDPPSVAGYFSYSPIELSTGMSGFLPSGTDRRKVVILQAVDQTNNAQTIAWQRYFYGSSFSASLGGHATNPRAVAVWAAEDPANVRVAICGEMFDEDLPADGLGSIGTATRPSGFIAVYNGNGVLRWSHLLHGALGRLGSTSPTRHGPVRWLGTRSPRHGLTAMTLLPLHCSVAITSSVAPTTPISWRGQPRSFEAARSTHRAPS